VVQPRRVLQVGAVAAVLALLGVLVWHAVTRRGGGALVAAVEHKRMPVAPPFDLPVISHESEAWPKDLGRVAAADHISLVDLRGRTLVVNFWASWCLPCKRETPLLAQSAYRHAGRVVVLGINVQDLRRPAQRFLAHYAVPYVSAADPGLRTFTAYGLSGLPETYVIDRRGRVVAHETGEVSGTALERAIQDAEKTKGDST
jgi:cytochrome c biogenesis protein CcmG/thiol:disulfide interchange protein DsbE